jgi:hypothetical protein
LEGLRAKTAASPPGRASQVVCDRFKGENVMRAIILAATALVTVALTSSAFAQKSIETQMDEMKTKDPQGFAACQALATSRGYRLGQPDYEGKAVMMFIEGCMMGRGR